MHDNTYTLQVEVDILLLSVLVVDSCGIPLVLCLFQSLLFHFLHLCSQLDLLMVNCTEVLGYTTWDYSVVVRYYTAVAQCYIVVAQCYNVVVQCYIGLVLG
jgi:hypothetical protein